MCVCVYVCMCEEEEEEEICLFNIVCSYTNSAMLITYTCRETPNGWNLISRLQGATYKCLLFRRYRCEYTDTHININESLQ